MMHIHNDTITIKRNELRHKKFQKIGSWQPKGARKKGKEPTKWKEKKRANNKASSMKPDDVCAYSLRFYAKRISRLVPLLAYWFHWRGFFQSHLSSSSILSRRLAHSYEKIIHTYTRYTASGWLGVGIEVEWSGPFPKRFSWNLNWSIGLLVVFLPIPTELQFILQFLNWNWKQFQYFFNVSTVTEIFFAPDSRKSHQFRCLVSYSSWWLIQGKSNSPPLQC